MDQVTITLSKQDPGQLRSAPDHIECPFGVASYFRSAPTSGHHQTSPACLVGANNRISTSRLSGLQISCQA
jgi:hypothetical protein